MINMDIVDERKKKEKVEIREVRAGQVFEYKDDFYMMTDDETDYTAIKLSSGLLMHCYGDSMVKLCEAKLVVFR